MVLFGIVVILVCMQNWKEKASELGQWELKGVPILYPILFITLLIPILFWNVENIRCFDDFTIADDSARYLLSALVQSLAAIIAIVVTLTLVAVQLTASAYSPRVIDIFKKDWVMWLLLVWYSLSIFFGLFVLEMIGGEYRNLGHWGVSLEFCVFLAYSMGIAAFVGLFCHVGNVINILKPETIIKRLAIKITKDNILNSKKYPEKDPIQPIMDIIHSSIMKYDLETVRVGLKAVTDRMIEIIDSDSQKEIITFLCNHFRRVRMLTVDKMDDEATGEVIKSLETFGKSTAKKNLGYATQKIARSIELTGELAAKKGEGFDASTWQAVESLKLVEKVVMEKGEKFKTAAASIALSLSNVAIAAAENKREWPTIWAVSSLEEIGKDAVKHELVRVTRMIVFSLLRVGVIAVKKGLDAAEDAAQALATLMILSEEIVGNVIRDHESEIKEQDHDALQKFMKIYEQELEKQLSEKPECPPYKKETHS